MLFNSSLRSATVLSYGCLKPSLGRTADPYQPPIVPKPRMKAMYDLFAQLGKSGDVDEPV